MKNVLEALAVGMVGLLSLGLIFLVVKYNMIDTGEANIQETEVISSVQNEPVKKEQKVANYLEKLEGYEDVDVKVDPKSKASGVNVATIESEANENGIVETIGTTVETVQKTNSYVNKLEQYDPNAQAKEEPKVQTPQEENVVESTPESEDQPAADPMSDIVNNIDAVIDESLEQKK